MSARIGVAMAVASACGVATLAGPASVARASSVPEPPAWVICAAGLVAGEAVAHATPLEPANSATVLAGTPVTFSAKSSDTVTFSVASSQALLSSPDIDSGTGVQLEAFSRFISSKATATPRTIYWTASFTLTPPGCETASTFISPVQTLIVAPSEAELAAAKQHQEEEAAKKKQEEEAAAMKKEEEAAAAGTVALDGVTIAVEGGRDAAVKLTCSDVERCAGKLTLTASAAAPAKARHGKTESIGSASFSIGAGERATLKLPLDKSGRALLSAARGHLSATLTIARTAPLPEKTRTEHVHLAQYAAADKGR
jgi:hypothetical protein